MYLAVVIMTHSPCAVIQDWSASTTRQHPIHTRTSQDGLQPNNSLEKATGTNRRRWNEGSLQTLHLFHCFKHVGDWVDRPESARPDQWIADANRAKPSVFIHTNPHDQSPYEQFPGHHSATDGSGQHPRRPPITGQNKTHACEENVLGQF